MTLAWEVLIWGTNGLAPHLPPDWDPVTFTLWGHLGTEVIGRKGKEPLHRSSSTYCVPDVLRGTPHLSSNRFLVIGSFS